MAPLKRYSTCFDECVALAPIALDGYGHKGGVNDLTVPVATPQPIVARLHREVSALMEQSSLRERFSDAGLEPLRDTQEEFTARMRSELQRWREVVKTGNIHAD